MGKGFSKKVSRTKSRTIQSRGWFARFVNRLISEIILPAQGITEDFSLDNDENADPEIIALNQYLKSRKIPSSLQPIMSGWDCIPPWDQDSELLISKKYLGNNHKDEDDSDVIQLYIMQNRLEDLENAEKKRSLSEEELKERNNLRQKLQEAASYPENWLALDQDFKSDKKPTPTLELLNNFVEYSLDNDPDTNSFAIVKPEIDVKAKQITYLRYAVLVDEQIELDNAIVSINKAKLDTIKLINEREWEKPIDEQQYIVYFNGNCVTCQEKIEEMSNDVLALKCHAVGFNYRGVYGSTGKVESIDDLIEDGVAQVKQLLNCEVDGKTVAAKNITLYGYSLGGAIATKVANRLHDEGYHVKLFNERSFTSITDICVGWLSKVFGRGLGESAKPYIKSFLKRTGWEVNVIKDYENIPRADKECIAAVNDPVISDYASLPHRLRHREGGKALNPKTISYTLPTEWKKKSNAHIVPRDHLIDSDKVSAADFFYSFFNRKNKQQALLENIPQLSIDSMSEIKSPQAVIAS